MSSTGRCAALLRQQAEKQKRGSPSTTSEVRHQRQAGVGEAWSRGLHGRLVDQVVGQRQEGDDGQGCPAAAAIGAGIYAGFASWGRSSSM